MMASAPSEQDLDGVRELMSRCSLSAIEYHELSARWTGPREEGDLANINFSVNLQYRLADDSFGIRMNGGIDVPFGDAQSVIAAVYEYEGETPELRTVLAFANEVAVMTLAPYLREAISTITAKVFGEPILMPILPRGEIAFDLDEVTATE